VIAVEKSEEKLKRAFESTDLVDVIQSASNEATAKDNEIKKIAIQFRVAREDVPSWLSIIDFILQECEEQDEEDKWSVHCCKHYERQDGRLGFVWLISVSSASNIKRAVNDVSRAVRTFHSTLKLIPQDRVERKSAIKHKPEAASRAAQAVKARSSLVQSDPIINVSGNKVEVVEMPLAGVSHNRNSPKKPGGKGAQCIKGV
jgi:hypothetical protein